MRAVALPALALLALVSACRENEGANGPERKTAAGEVLGGSISDEMLPLPTVTSQSPPLRESAADDGEKTAGDADDKEGVEAAPAATPSPEPSAPASASATPEADD